MRWWSATGRGTTSPSRKPQTQWVKDAPPAVEPVIGFVETYEDPHGVRGAWEGIVAITNLEQRKQFKQLGRAIARIHRPAALERNECGLGNLGVERLRVSAFHHA
jgi:hypothetical protein